ncbi:YbjN domain-containing protein [Cellulomonas sp. Sa3CUA2]|uniref:YbjN domain-containing protein n=1 Tax=Cellulomonas avistercoris TaxID=2762242 RepID=A0ABR8QI30_9CELL|nr:YbjN domain-containing protein [Cellulomonas avistercoris]MBD7920078.1 YbjN domain-containing protein [Cellulomonas avistercoris]
MSAPGWLLRVLGGLPKPTKGRSLDDEPPRPLTRDRVADYLLARGYRFVVDDDGDLTGTWDGSRFWFLLLGEQQEILQVRGRWHRSLPLEQRRALALALNDWNRERIWPKAYAREEEGMLAVYAEVSADLEPGVTDVQLAQLLACGLGTGVQLFAALDPIVPADGAPPPDVPDN